MKREETITSTYLSSGKASTARDWPSKQWRVKLADKSSGLTICTDEVRHEMAKYMEVLCEKRRGFKVNPQDSGFSVLTARDGRVGAAARKREHRRAAEYREV